MTLATFIALMLGAPDAGAVIVTDASLSDAPITEAFVDSKIQRPPPAPDYDAPVRAEAAQAKQWCQEGRKLSVGLKTSAAIEKYEQALNAFESALPGVIDYNVIRECLVDLASAWLDDDNDARAAETFARALMIDEKKGIDRSRYRPNVVARFQQTKKALARAATGSLTIASAPSGREVLLDGKKRGTTPLSIGKLLPGTHWLLVQAPGYQPFQARVSVRAGGVERVDVILRARDRSPEDVVLDLAVGESYDPAALTAATELAADAPMLVAVRQTNSVIVGRAVRGKRVTPLIEAASLTAFASAVQAAFTEQPASAPTQTETAAIGAPREAPLAPRLKTHWALAALPFGIAQFIERRPVAGALLLITQLGLLATNIVCYVLLRNDRTPEGRYADVPRDTALTWVVNVSFGVLIAEIIGGAIDGELHR